MPLNQDKIEWIDLAFDPDGTPMGEPMTLEAAFPGLISAGRPLVLDAIALAIESGVEPSPTVATRSQNNDFTYVFMPISIRHSDSTKVRRLVYEVTLRSPGRSAIPCSIDPVRVDQEIKVGRTVKITAGIELEPVSLEADYEAEREYSVRRPIITAFGLRAPVFGWDFVPRGEDLVGLQYLHAIIESPAGMSFVGEVRIEAQIDDNRYGLWNWLARGVHDPDRVVVNFKFQPHDSQ